MRGDRSPIAKEALDRIAAIYAIEDKARFAPAAERVEHRRETAPLLDRREALTRFVTDGRLEVDNNVAENAMRGIAM